MTSFGMLMNPPGSEFEKISPQKRRRGFRLRPAISNAFATTRDQSLNAAFSGGPFAPAGGLVRSNPSHPDLPPLSATP
jgi:hypothetical protein